MSDASTMMRYDAMKKSMVAAYVLWWFLGLFGAHRFYLNRTGSAVAMLVITLVSLPLMFFLVGFITIGITSIWWVVDAFLIPDMIRGHNLRLADAMTPRG